MTTLPDWLDSTPWRGVAANAREPDVRRALESEDPREEELAILLSPAADRMIETLAQRAFSLTRSHFGNTVSLYVPLYLSDYCTGGCVYCGFASDRAVARHCLSPDELTAELRAIKDMGAEEVLLLTGERTPAADFAYLRSAVAGAARQFHAVTVEAFPMTVDEYRQLADAGCVGVTLYQETYDPIQYDLLHRWGPKKDYAARLDAPDRVLAAGMRFAGLGVLLGIADPMADLLCLFRHAAHLRRTHWRAGVSLSFPRVCAQRGDYAPPFPVSERFLAQIIFAFRICLPDVPLVLSTREGSAFRDGMAGVGVSKMSVASRTTVGGYVGHAESPDGQFHVNDNRDVKTFCEALRRKGLEPVFKNWDAIFRGGNGDAERGNE
jgi:2-iminoacetate synthase